MVLNFKVTCDKKLILARLGVSRPICDNVDSPNLGFPYFNFLGGTSEKNHPVSGEFLIAGEYDDEGNDGDGAVVVVGQVG